MYYSSPKKPLDIPANLPKLLLSSINRDFSSLALQANPKSAFKPFSRFDSDIVSFELNPGLRPSMIRLVIKSGQCHGILLKSLGAGNVPSLDEYSLLPVIEESTKLGIPVLISTKFVGGVVHPGIYKTGSDAIKAGGIPTGDLTDVAAQVKLMFGLAQGHTSPEDIKKFIFTNLAGEITIE